MKQITIQKQTKKLVVDGTIDVTAYEASDGTVFEGLYAENECTRYELKLKHKPIMDKIAKKTTYGDFPLVENLPREWFYIGSEEDMDAIKTHLHLDTNNYHKFFLDDNALSVGNWIGITIEYGGDHQDTANIFTWDYLKEQIDLYVNEFGE